MSIVDLDQKEVFDISGGDDNGALGNAVGTIFGTMIGVWWVVSDARSWALNGYGKVQAQIPLKDISRRFNGNPLFVTYTLFLLSATVTGSYIGGKIGEQL